MKLIKPYFQILNKFDFDFVSKEIEQAARTCYKSEDKIEEGSDIKLIEKLINSGHEAMLEFGSSIAVKFVCDRGVSHELVRHRLCSFAQESTRYCNYSKDKFDNQITFIIPCFQNFENWIKEGVYPVENSWRPNNLAAKRWFKIMLDAELYYNTLIKTHGWLPQEARSILPNSLKTEIVVKANIREWRHIFQLRTSKKAHPQMRELMIPLLKEFQSYCPILFNDIKIEE